MHFNLEAFFIALALSCDALSAAIVLGLKPFSLKQKLLFALLTALIAISFTTVGFYAGEYIVRHFAFIDHWIAFFLLFSIALHMLYEAYSERRDGSRNDRSHKYKKLFVVAIATNIDAIGVGMSLRILHKPMDIYLGSIFVTTFFAICLGVKLSSYIKQSKTYLFQYLGAVVLMALAIKMLEI